MAAELPREGTASSIPPTAEVTPGGLAPRAVVGFLATLSIVIGAVLGGSSFETHLPGAWFFGMPGGLFGSIGSNEAHPPIYSIAAVYGGLIL